MKKNKEDGYLVLNIIWLISGLIWLPLYIIFEILERLEWMNKPKWMKWWGNRVDNLPDSLTQWIHCHKIPYTNYQFNIAFMMKNRARPYWPIIRKHGIYPNCDSEDK
jgi:hypothetical protein